MGSSSHDYLLEDAMQYWEHILMIYRFFRSPKTDYPLRYSGATDLRLPLPGIQGRIESQQPSRIGGAVPKRDRHEQIRPLRAGQRGAEARFLLDESR